MKDLEHKFWPYQPKVSILSAIIILIGLLILSAILRSTIGWPSDGSTNTVLIGILFLSLLPLLLSILDVIIDRGGTIGYKDFKIDFSKVQKAAESHFIIPANIGMRGQPVADSGTSNILDTLKDATSTSTAVIDLEDGHAWWETRLLVLLAGAERLRKPEKIVFVAKNEGKDQCFQGWCNPSELLHCLLEVNPLYKESLAITRAAARQWELVEPLEEIPPGNFRPIPAQPAWINGMVSNNTSWMAFNQKGLPNELMAEQTLQNILGQKIENFTGSVHITIARLTELFQPVLIKQHVDESWPADKQRDTFFNTDSAWVALTNNGKYSALVSRISVMNEMLREMVK